MIELYGTIVRSVTSSLFGFSGMIGTIWPFSLMAPFGFSKGSDAIGITVSSISTDRFGPNSNEIIGSDGKLGLKFLMDHEVQLDD